MSENDVKVVLGSDAEAALVPLDDPSASNVVNECAKFSVQPPDSQDAQDNRWQVTPQVVEHTPSPEANVQQLQLELPKNMGSLMIRTSYSQRLDEDGQSDVRFVLRFPAKDF